MIIQNNIPNKSSLNLLVISFHTCPLSPLGTESAGGMNVYISKLSIALEKLGFSIDIITKKHRECTEDVVYLSKQTKVIHLSSIPLNIKKNKLYHYLDQFEKSIMDFIATTNNDYDLIHSHYWLSGMIGVNLSKNLNINNITTFHTLAEIKNKTAGQEKESLIRSNYEDTIIKNADKIVVSTKHEMNVLQNSYDVNSTKVEIIEPGVDLDLFKPQNKNDSKKLLGLINEPVLLYVGRIDPIKGLSVLIEAMNLLNYKDRPKLLVIGDNNQSNPTMLNVLEIIERYELQEDVVFIGATEQSNLPLYYNAADICVIPSHYESFGLVALEAMACNTPVIGTKVPGLESIITDQINGLLIIPNSPQILAEKIKLLISDKDLAKLISQNGLKKSMEMTWDSTAEKITYLYRSLID
jgi:D-inositol-3-phosphate glycosyltransferase